MKKTWLFVVFLVQSIFSMEEEIVSSGQIEIVVHPTPDSTLAPPRTSDPLSDTESVMGDEEEESLSNLALQMYFRNPEERVVSEFMPRVRNRIAQLQHTPSHERRQMRRDLRAFNRQMAERNHHDSHPAPIHSNYAHLHDYLSSVINDSVAESLTAAQEEREYQRERIRNEQRNKRLAIIAGIGTTVVTLVTTLAVTFSENNCS